VKFGLVGFGHMDNKYYPDYFTIDGNIGYNGETDKISFPNEPWNSSLTIQNLFDTAKDKTIDTFFGVYHFIIVLMNNKFLFKLENILRYKYFSSNFRNYSSH
jgi:hypothetical protein